MYDTLEKIAMVKQERETTISSVESSILEWIQDHRIEQLDGFLVLFSSATTIVSLTFILMIGVIARFRRSCLREIFQVAVTLLLAALIGYGIKQVIHRERPFRSFSNVEKLTTGGSPSFPSGHTLEAFAVATSISLLTRRKLIRVFVFSWACLVGYSRLALGVHYPSDVLGGLLTGILLAIAVDYGFKKWIPQPGIK